MHNPVENLKSLLFSCQKEKSGDKQKDQQVEKSYHRLKVKTFKQAPYSPDLMI